MPISAAIPEDEFMGPQTVDPPAEDTTMQEDQPAQGHKSVTNGDQHEVGHKTAAPTLGDVPEAWGGEDSKQGSSHQSVANVANRMATTLTSVPDSHRPKSTFCPKSQKKGHHLQKTGVARK